METHVEEIRNAPAPFAALQRLHGLPRPLLMESAARHSGTGRFSFLTADPFEVVDARVSGLPGGGDVDPFLRLRERLAPFAEATIPGLPPFQAGAAGCFGYELGRSLERIPVPPIDDQGLPDLIIGLYDWTLAWDHQQDRCWLLSTGLPAAGAVRSRRAAERVRQVLSLLGGDAAPPPRPQMEEAPAATEARALPAPSHALPGLPGVSSTFSRAEYLAAVARVREYIHAGDIFQANLSQRLCSVISIQPLELYRRLRERSPAPYAAYFHTGEAALVSSSPELFLRLRGGEVETRPIKGTAPRSGDRAEDARLAEVLRRSEKDRAENVMIVDLLRNDLSRVCTDPSVVVPRLCEVESHGPVHHLVSTVRGELRPGCDAIDLLRASFPGGSITGAPKIRAMEIIAELEPTRRGPYTGSIGYIGFDGSMETSIVIRTFVVRDGTAYFQVGGGIVADSVPEREFEETLHKAGGMLAALREEM